MISVIIPLYNTEMFCAKAISSACEQTYTNLEILIVDDGSTDDGYRICAEYAVKDNRIRIIRQPNRGLSEARNTGIREARGEYLFFLDSDDYIHPKTMEYLLAGIEANHCDIAVCRYLEVEENSDSCADICDDIQKVKWRCFDPVQSLYNIYDESMGLCFTLTWNKLYKKEVFEEIRFPIGKIHEDEGTTWKVLIKSRRTCFCEEKLYYYRQRRDSIIHRENLEKRLALLDFMQERQRYFKKMQDESDGQYKGLADAAERRYLYRMIWFYYVLGRNNKADEQRKVLCRFKAEWVAVHPYYCKTKKERILFWGFYKCPRLFQYVVEMRGV